MSRRVKKIRALGLCAAAVYVGLCQLRIKGFTFVEWWQEAHSGVVFSHAPAAQKVVALTFDDGPDPRYTPRVLEILQQNSIHATFFLEGRMVDRYPEIAYRTLAQGHSIGNHTYSHPYLTRLSANAIHAEIAGCAQSLHTNLHIATPLFRPPRGEWNPIVFQEAQRRHDTIILWSLALEHHEVPTAPLMAERVLRLVQPGDIILMHDGALVSRETTVQALPLLLAGLRQRGYRCVTVPELLHIAGNVPVASNPPSAFSPSFH